LLFRFKPIIWPILSAKAGLSTKKNETEYIETMNYSKSGWFFSKTAQNQVFLGPYVASGDSPARNGPTKVRTIIKANKTAKAGNLLLMLNPVIRGWANFHRHVVSKKMYYRVDDQVFIALWRWAKRRHPTKAKGWVRRKYFDAPHSRWAFHGMADNHKGQTRQVWLWKARPTPIQRHIKVRSQANPYDPEWETYFEKRLDEKTVANLRSRESLRWLWLSQQGICPVCQQKITKQTGWHSHHIVWKVFGGHNGMSNRVLLHPDCHEQVHALKLTVEKPRRF
jgi:RNA-directed DNA polymerase